MKTKKMLSLGLLTLALSSMAMAAEYASPDVGFKKHVIPSKEMKTADFGDYYKVEGAVATDRQIASEEESDREPSSVVAKEKKKFVEEKAEDQVEAPKPWLYKNDTFNQK